VFRVLHALDPEQEYRVIFQALQRGASHRAGSRELLEHLVEGPLRDGMLAMADAAEPLEQLRSATTYFQPEGAKSLLDLLSDGRGVRELPPEQRTRLEELSLAVLAAVERDGDPILASSARHCAAPRAGAEPRR
jgi:hypothetical protein